jgi:hypothetical protein
MTECVDLAPMCFACGKDNPIGLKIDFSFDGEFCSGEFTGQEHHVGWQSTIHGGIVYSALDDVTANVVYLQGRKAHTAKCEIEKGCLVILKGEARRKSDGVLVADCESSFMVFS